MLQLVLKCVLLSTGSVATPYHDTLAHVVRHPPPPPTPPYNPALNHLSNPNKLYSIAAPGMTY